MNRDLYDQRWRASEWRVTFARLRAGDRLAVVALLGAAFWLLLAVLS